MSSNFDAMPDSAFVRVNDLAPAVVPVGVATIWRWARTGKFPKPVKLSAAVTAWRVADVRAWMQAQQQD